jgi:hypothetical protein
MVAVAQLVESRIVIPVVVGSSPISHPIYSSDYAVCPSLVLLEKLMATFRKRANAWQVRIQRSGYPEQSKSFKSRSEAMVWARKVESELDNGVIHQQLNVNSKVLLKDLLERYKSEVTIHKKHPAAEAYRINFWLRHSLANQLISSIKSSDIAKWRVKLGRSPNTLRLELAVLSNLFTVAANEWGYEELSNPTTRVKLPRLPSGRVRRLGLNEFELIIQNSASTLLRPIANQTS